MGKRAFRGIIFVALVCLSPFPLSAQIITGTVRDSLSREKVPNALVVLLTPDSTPLTRTTTDRSGTFRLPVPSPGGYRVFVYGMGYAEEVSPILTVLDREGTEITLLLRPDPVALDSLEVVTEARTRQLELAGFYKRKDMGFGYFIEREEIERSSYIQTTDLLLPLPRQGAPRPGCAGGRAFVLDGHVVDTSLINVVVHPSWIEALEVYPGPAGVPAQYRIPGRSCGAILIWTRR